MIVGVYGNPPKRFKEDQLEKMIFRKTVRGVSGKTGFKDEMAICPESTPQNQEEPDPRTTEAVDSGALKPANYTLKPELWALKPEFRALKLNPC